MSAFAPSLRAPGPLCIVKQLTIKSFSQAMRTYARVHPRVSRQTLGFTPLPPGNCPRVQASEFMGLPAAERTELKVRLLFEKYIVAFRLRSGGQGCAQ